MVKNLSINGVKPHIIRHLTAPMSRPEMPKKIDAIVCLSTATGMLPEEVSTFLKNFNKTSTENENYFQLKINPETGKPFKENTFQRAAAMNLYLGNDVLVTAPTGSGKTAIAEYIITKNFLEGKKTFYTAPLKALSNQKYRDFCKTYGKDNVGILTGDTKVNTDAPIIIMTTEVYRNMTASEQFNLNNPNRELLKDSLQTVIFDELQYLGDEDRGGVWEQSLMFTPKNVQILSLSATIGNNEEINNWIASLKGRKGVNVGINSAIDEHYLPNQSHTKETVLINVPSENRPVPLKHIYYKAIPEIKEPKSQNRKEQIKARKEGLKQADTIYAKPAFETYKQLTQELKKSDRLPAIYFIFSKKESRKLLEYLSKEGELLTTREEKTEIAKITKEYRKSGIYLGESLNENALLNGYAVHNSGLLPSQKQLIEELFQKKLVKVLLATDTMSAGINMPAKTTVISSPRKPGSTSDGGPDNKRNQSPNELGQESGRAGRPGYDTEGFAYMLYCNEKQKELYENLIRQKTNSIKSNFDVDYAFIANYTSEYLNEDILRNTLSKSLYVRDKQGGFDNHKFEDLMERYRVRRNILGKGHCIDKNGHLTLKGELIKGLNGYEQTPIINLISNNNLLAYLDEVELAAVIGGLANIEYKTKDENKNEVGFYTGGSINPDFYNALETTYYNVKDYERLSSALYPNRSLNINGDIVQHIYKWADLNALSPYNSKRNWQHLYSKLNYSIRDEGSLFKEITSTVDLMKQLVDIAKIGENYSERENDKEYYRSLADKLNKGINLLQKEPVTEDNV